LPEAETTATATGFPAQDGQSLPELVNVRWRRRTDDRALRRAGRLWTASTVAHSVPFVAISLLLAAVSPIIVPFALICLAHAWAIPELYAARGARVVKPRPAAGPRPELVALGLLGDLVGHRARDLHARTGLILERGQLGVWLVGEAGALLVRPGGRRVNCYCISATDGRLPSSDRIAHLLLALRTDEIGFVTVANLAFSGAGWRVRRRLRSEARPALTAAVSLARSRPSGPER
jgi:hypothetical protein